MRINRKIVSSFSEPEDWFCLVCSEAYNQSKGDWVECVICKLWVHIGCVKKDLLPLLFVIIVIQMKTD